MSSRKNEAVVVQGLRTPFVRSYRSYLDLKPYELGSIVLSELISRSQLSAEEIGHVCMGCVIGDPATPNVAREALLNASLPAAIPAHTVSLACVSANMATTSIVDMIRLGQIEAGIAGGTDTCSDPPIRVSREWRKLLIKLQKAKGAGAMISLLKEFKHFKKLSDFFIEVPKVAEFSNGKTMGQGCEIVAQQAGVTREEADSFAAESHRLACEAAQWLGEDLVAVYPPPGFKPVTADEGPRQNSTTEALAKLRPAFDRKFGVSTAGNSSFLTDGAAAVLVMSRQKAESSGSEPLAVIRDYVYRAGDPLGEMLSGPALTIPDLLARNKLKIDDVGVWEIHEAFAAQVVANLKLLADDDFAKKRLGHKQAVGMIPRELINQWGGSLSLGHPFGATGARLIWTAARRLQHEKQRYAVVSGCAAGGHGSAILLENINL